MRRALYRLPLEQPPLDLAERCRAFLEQPHHWVERTRPNPRRLDLRPYIDELRAGAAGLEMALWVTPTGAARPDEVLEVMGLAHLMQDGATWEQTDRLEIEDELPATAPRSARMLLQAQRALTAR